MKTVLNHRSYLTKTFQCIFIVMYLVFSQINLIAQSCPPEGLYFGNQNAIAFFQVIYPECTIIQGDVFIGTGNSSDIHDLSGLRNIKVIEGNLIINNNDELVFSQGLDSLREVQGDLHITNNNNLITIDSLPSLEVVNGLLLISGNNKLETIDGLSSLNKVGDLFVEYNLSLKNIKGLSNLETVTRDLTIQGNELITDLEGLNTLEFIGSDFLIANNFTLKNLNGLSAEAYKGLEIFSIIGNQYLESLEGLDHFNLNSLTELVIRDNPNLSVCNVKSMCDFIGSYRIPELSGNKSSCTVDYIEKTCVLESIDDFYKKYPVVISPNPATDWLEIRQSNYFRTPIYYEIIDLNDATILAGYFDDQPIDISSLQQGLFFIKVAFIDNDVFYRFVKK